ncbi:Shiga toxin A subunit [Atlantibacter sp.]|uniref:Shiga toxin A subunit n=1 Tax=Atlantibacter sp. TaxID=1903473 RepID=UPI00289BF611|nr:Shiga toxin A subunit [Atlantibacter sp.]
MIRRYVLVLAMLPFTGHATDLPGSECAGPGHYNEEMLLSAVSKDGVKGIDRGKTKVEILSIEPVSDIFAHQLAQADAKGGNGLSVKDYYNVYYDKDVLNLTAKYTYTDSKGKRDVFIASSLLNNNECSVRFNGYLTVSREF